MNNNWPYAYIYQCYIYILGYYSHLYRSTWMGLLNVFGYPTLRMMRDVLWTIIGPILTLSTSKS